jgi:ATP-binding cassette subfamily F protein 3
MLTVHRLTKTYGIQPILKDISFSISSGERVGLIGPNGCGKSTLMRILAGLEAPDSGTIARTRSNLRIGYLAQGFEPAPGATIQSTLNLDNISETELEAEITLLASQLTAEPANVQLQEKYDNTLQKISNPISPNTVLIPLGLSELDGEMPVSYLSGGQKTRLMLARLLLNEPHLLLLDEPTNHLDIQMLEWLEGWLSDFKGAVLIVSHDRSFLDNTVTSILDLDPATHELRHYAGNYSDYIEQKEAERERQLQTYLDQQAEIRRMKQDIARTKAQAEQTEREASSIRIGGPDYKLKGFKSYQQGIAKKVAKKAKSREKKLERFVESDEIVERPGRSWQMKLEFSEPIHKSKDICVAEKLAVGYPSNPPLLENLDFYIRAGQRIALTGANGTGKTTLLRTIAGILEPVNGTLRLGTSIKLGYMTQEQERLDPALSALEHIQTISGKNETEARQFLHYFLFSGDDPLRPASSLSYGERARLMLALLVAEGCNFLLLDEPINHLDIPARARFEQALSQFEGTVLAVVHDRYFIERFASHVWLMDEGRIRQL